MSTCLTWISGSKLILSNNQSSATLWVLDTCLIVGLGPLIIILITASLSSKMYNWDSPREKCVLVRTVRCYLYMECTQRECKPIEITIDEYRKCSNHEFLLEQLKNCQGGKNLTQRRWRGLTTWKDLLENAFSDTATWQTKRQSSFSKSQVLWLDDHQFKQEELDSVGD